MTPLCVKYDLRVHFKKWMSSVLQYNSIFDRVYNLLLSQESHKNYDSVAFPLFEV